MTPNPPSPPPHSNPPANAKSKAPKTLQVVFQAHHALARQHSTLYPAETHCSGALDALRVQQHEPCQIAAHQSRAQAHPQRPQLLRDGSHECPAPSGSPCREQQRLSAGHGRCCCTCSPDLQPACLVQQGAGFWPQGRRLQPGKHLRSRSRGSSEGLPAGAVCSCSKGPSGWRQARAGVRARLADRAQVCSSSDRGVWHPGVQWPDQGTCRVDLGLFFSWGGGRPSSRCGDATGTLQQCGQVVSMPHRPGQRFVHRHWPQQFCALP